MSDGENGSVKVSVIVPICNVERYLRECLDSILAQTLKELEIILLDDGSTDSCPVIMEEYRKRDHRIIAVYKKNSGYGATVNLGFRMAKGKYIAIVEPDDYIAPEMYETLYHVAECMDVDFVKSDYSHFIGDGNERKLTLDMLYSFPNLYDHVVHPFEEPLSFQGYIANWTGLYRSSFLKDNHIFHNETPGASYQDQGFNFLVHALADRVWFTHDDFYRYRQDNVGASMASTGKVYCIPDEFDYMEQEMLKRKIPETLWHAVWYERKFATYMDNLERIHYSRKMEFLEYMQREFLEDERTGKFQRRYLPDWRLEIYDRMITRSEEAQRELKRKIMKEFFSGDSIWIYGTGKVSEWLWEDLNDQMKSNIKGYIVSEKEERKSFKGLPVFSINEAPAAKDEMILIATAKGTAESIKENLEKNGYTNMHMIREYMEAR